MKVTSQIRSLDLFDADVLTGEDLAEIDFLPIEADAPAGGHGDGLVVERVVELGQTGVGTRRGQIVLRGALHVERLVRTLVVVAVDEVVELGLLLQEVASPAGLVVSSFRVRCMRSCRPFCCGWPGLIRSISMPSLSHQTESLERLKRALGLAKGTPLSVRMALGRPNSLKAPQTRRRRRPPWWCAAPRRRRDSGWRSR